MIDLVCTVNKNYIQHLCATLASVLINTNENIHIHILNNDFLDEDKITVKHALRRFKLAEFSFYTVEDSLLTDIQVKAEHLTIQTLYRLLVAELLPNNIDKAIYLDCDLIVEEDIRLLYNIDLEDYYVGATCFLQFEQATKLELENVTDYLSAGVLLINLKKWRNNNFWAICKEYALKNPEKIVYGDQDILNGVLRGEWKKFGLEWNYTTDIPGRNDVYKYHLGPSSVNIAMKNPTIIHYIGGLKPWHAFNKHTYKSRYFHYLDQIDYTYKKFPEIDILKKKTVVLFGASVLGISTLEQLKQMNIEVHYFCDNDSSKWKKDYYSTTIISPNELMKCRNVAIIITSMYEKEISHQLVELGFNENIDWFKLTKLEKLPVE